MHKLWRVGDLAHKVVHRVWPKGSPSVEEESDKDKPSFPLKYTPKIDREYLRAEFRDQKWNTRLFVDANGLKGKFFDCDFSYSVFERAYFRDAEFTNCRFVGARFFECNFKGAKFYLCDLRFSQFHRSQIDTKEILAALPSDPNMRRDCLQNLRANSVEIGDYPSQRLFVLEEIEATKEHYRRTIWGTDSYYRKKYAALLPKIEAAWKLFWLQLSSLVWGNGERPANILISAVLILLAFTLINFWSIYPRVGWFESIAGLKVLQYTTSLFLDLPTESKFRGFLLVDYLIVIMRYLYIGLYISVLYRKISYR
jgi:hypothetical protein